MGSWRFSSVLNFHTRTAAELAAGPVPSRRPVQTVKVPTGTRSAKCERKAERELEQRCHLAGYTVAADVAARQFQSIAVNRKWTVRSTLIRAAEMATSRNYNTRSIRKRLAGRPASRNPQTVRALASSTQRHSHRDGEAREEAEEEVRLGR